MEKLFFFEMQVKKNPGSGTANFRVLGSENPGSGTGILGTGIGDENAYFSHMRINKNFLSTTCLQKIKISFFSVYLRPESTRD
jgi:hypothetical protein